MLCKVLDSDGIIVPVADPSRGVLSSLGIARLLSRTMRTSAQLLVVSPDSTLLQAAGRCAEASGHTAFLTRSLSQARRTLTRVAIDLICLDSVLPSKELERFWRWLSSDHHRANTRVLLLAPPSAIMAPASLPPFFQPKRDGIVQKPLEAQALEREVARLLADIPQPKRDDGLLRVAAVTLDSTTHQLLFANGGALTLTPTELRLLHCLMRRPGQYVSPEELLEQVWGYPPGTGGREVVRAHVSNLRRKLRNIGEDPQLLRTIPYLGYSFNAETAQPI